MSFKEFSKSFSNPEKLVTSHVDRYLYGLNFVENHRRKYCHHPSQLGKCIRKLQYEFLDTPHKDIIKPQTQFVFAMGHALQEVYVQFMIASGLIERRHVEYALHNDALNIHGHADIYHDGAKWGADLKTIRVAENNAVAFWDGGKKILVPWESFDHPHEDHVWQMHAYMLCAPEATQWQIIYLNKNDQSTKEFYIPRDEKKLKVLADKVTQINEANHARKLVDRPDGYMPYTPPCRFCAYRDRCHNDFVETDFHVIDAIEAGVIDLSTGTRNDKKANNG